MPLFNPQELELLLENERNAAIERCAQIVQDAMNKGNIGWQDGLDIIAAIRKLKHKQIDPNIVYPSKDPDSVFPEE